ncbi:MAG: TetR family transcriptional regulator [Rhodopseudomonas sp.]|nr:TetR family transcriptional regulator [Rhodopseudomonas sp.]
MSKAKRPRTAGKTAKAAGPVKAVAAKPAVKPVVTSVVKRVRLAPTDRSDQILKGAISFFAARGFGGQTRELARELGISKGLLYRYFPSKDVLIDRIYDEMFVRRWEPEWDTVLIDRSLPLLVRLKRFYLSYSKMLHDYEWVRIYLYSSLHGSTIAKRFAKMVNERIYKPIVGELRHEFGLPGLAEQPMSEPESELMWALHGGIFYIGVRKWVYRVTPPQDIAGTVTRAVERIYADAQDLMRSEQLRRQSPGVPAEP